MKKEIEKVEKKMSAYQEQSQSVERMIIEAIKSGLPVETMERILAMRDKLKAEYAKEQFIKAMSNFQANCPVIKKTKKVFDKTGKLRYSFAPIDSIVSQTAELIHKNGLSYFLRTERKEGSIIVSCVVSHIDGHRETSSFEVPIGSEDYMSEVQKFGARATFAKRYAFCDAFGIMTGDQDVDAIEPDKNEVSKAIEKIGNCVEMKSLQALWASLPKELKANKEVIRKANEIKNNIQHAQKNENI
jgi:ribosomal protein L29